MKKAKMVEGETAVRAVARLEDAYYTDTGAYSENLATIGYSPMPPLRYYTIQIELKKGPGYKVKVTGNLDGDAVLDAWVLEKKKDGTTTLRRGCDPKGNGKVKYDCSE